MRHGSQRRQRNNRSNRRGNNNRSQVFDSNGPDVRIRGTAHQVAEKYEALAKDAASAGDTILAESYLQHAEHYQRIISSWAQDETQQQNKNSERKEDVKAAQSDGNKSEEKPHRSKAPEKKDDLGLPSSILNAGVEGKLEDV